MREYMLVMTSRAQDLKAMGPDDFQKMMERYGAFVDVLKKAHGFSGGSALKQDGFQLKAGKNGIMIDGPFPETKEVLNGYMCFKARDYEEAISLARQCPALDYGETVQVFELTDHEG